MLALIAGTGDLPSALLTRLETPPLICALEGNRPQHNPDIWFRIEGLGDFLDVLSHRGVTHICMAGAINRPEIDLSKITAKTQPLVPQIAQALGAGDDGALRAVIAIFEGQGLTVQAAHEIAPDLLPPEGVATTQAPAARHHGDAQAGEAAIAALGAADIGQACIVRMGQVCATEDADGTAAMLDRFHDDTPSAQSTPYDPLLFPIEMASDAVTAAADWLSGNDGPQPVLADDGILFKAPKPDQDRRADLPVIGPDTAMQAAEAGLAGIVIEAGGVMVLDLPGVVQILDAQKMFLWVRPKGGG